MESPPAPARAGDTGDADADAGVRKTPEGRNGNLLQDSCLENPMD